MIDRTNHHVFQPLLYQVATATLAPTDIAAPIRWLLRSQKNTDVVMAEVIEIDPDRRVVRSRDGGEYDYDFLIVAAGARHSYFGHTEWEARAPGLKSIEDAIELRRRWLLAFERAERTTDAAERRGESHLRHRRWRADRRRAGRHAADHRAVRAAEGFPPHRHRGRANHTARGGPRLLPTFPEELSARARERISRSWASTCARTRFVTNVGDGFVEMGAERIESRTIFWAAGNAASSVGASLGGSRDRMGRVVVNDDLSIPGRPEVFVVGDLAVLPTRDKPVPGVAPAAMQSGRCAARNIIHTIRGEGRERFHYRNKGDLATIGRYRAVGVLAGRQLSGWFAWWTWLFVHIMYLAGFRNRLSVLLEWGYAFFTYQRGARLITADIHPPPESGEPLEPKW